MALKGSTQNLRRFNQSLQKMPTQVAQEVAKRGASAITTRAQATFDSGRNVYGDPFPDGVDCYDSGDTRSFLKFTSDGGTKIRASLGTSYAKYLIGKYQILPIGNAQLPVAWLNVLAEITKQEATVVVKAAA